MVVKMREIKLRWFGYVIRREETEVVRMIMKMTLKEEEENEEKD